MWPLAASMGTVGGMNTAAEPPYRRRRALRFIVAAALITGGLLAGTAAGVALSHRASEREIVTIAEQFDPPESWEVLLDDLEPARLLCLGGNACPSVRKDWSVPEALTPVDMQQLIDAAGWDLTVDGDCLARENFRGTEVNGVRDLVPVCSAIGSVDGVDVYLVQSGDVERPDAKMQLFARLSG